MSVVLMMLRKTGSGKIALQDNLSPIGLRAAVQEKSFDTITKFNPPEKMEMMKREGTKVIDSVRQLITD